VATNTGYIHSIETQPVQQVNRPKEKTEGSDVRRLKPPSRQAWSAMRVTKTLWPPQRGTLRLKRYYGAHLVCVRYRRDTQLGHRYTTVELLIDHGPVRKRQRGRRKLP
jgi:hypothetical protein